MGKFVNPFAKVTQWQKLQIILTPAFCPNRYEDRKSSVMETKNKVNTVI